MFEFFLESIDQFDGEFIPWVGECIGYIKHVNYYSQLKSILVSRAKSIYQGVNSFVFFDLLWSRLNIDYFSYVL